MGLSFAHRSRRINATYSMYCKIQFVVQNQDSTSQVFVIHINGKTLKINLLLILVFKMISSSKYCGIHFFLSTCGQNVILHEQIFCPKSDLKCQLACSGQIPQMPNARYLFDQKLCLLHLFKF